MINTVAAQVFPRDNSHSSPRPAKPSGAVGALQDQIRREKVQLNDWVTCVSAKTTKGQSEIQSLSAQISAAQQQIDRINSSRLPSAAAAQPTTSIDVWA